MNKDKLLDFLDVVMMAYSGTPTSPDYKIIEKYDNEKTGVQYFIGEKGENDFIISFRGTDEAKDWITDLKFWKKELPYENKKTKVRVHSGFYNSYLTIRDDILKFGEEHLSTSSSETLFNINIMGHSYGSALAVLCALDLQFNYPCAQFNVIVFGCPRIGNKHFVKSYNKRLIKTLRIENGNDIVTKLPFKFLGYSHVGIKIHIGFIRLLGLFSITQHFCTKYYESLWQK